MKEATGEASMTGITIAVIAVIAAIAVPLVTTMITNTSKKACCAGLGGTLNGNNCEIMQTNGTKTNATNWWNSSTKKCN